MANRDDGQNFQTTGRPPDGNWMDSESTLSGSETQETRPGWPPDDVCADLTRYKGSFDHRDREGLRLLSPLFQKKVLKLQRDLEEAKAES